MNLPVSRQSAPGYPKSTKQELIRSKRTNVQTRDFVYHLPRELIAHHPVRNRSDSRLLCLDRSRGTIAHRHFVDLPDFLQAEDLLVFNNTRVIPARLQGHKETGGKVEMLLERIVDDNTVLAQLKVSKSPGAGTRLYFPAVVTQNSAMIQNQGEKRPVTAVVLGREEEFYKLQFELMMPVLNYLESVGHIPLPPYIDRLDEPMDRERYQTVYSEIPGAVAAPTAGLHFDDIVMRDIEARGVTTSYLTLHVGAGTFQPVRVENVENHKMHSEWVSVPQKVCDQISACHKRGGKVIAVGTTTVRSLESAARNGVLKPFEGETDIFIYPGFRFKVVDAMVTNFHLPESTLLMLVSAFATKEKILDAYNIAVAEKYRFFSYGDAMYIY